ncbi:unnamed protein product [Schistosoma turkestanicum]|nr:unnamed protein product [Schistosoma turkestanicum]
MKYILCIALLYSVSANMEIQRRELCLSCDILQQCEQIVCNNVLVNGTFIPEYVIGCELACPFGNISCQKDPQNGTFIWLPTDPCLPEVSTTSEPNNTLLTTTTTSPTFYTTDITQTNTSTDSVVLNTTIFETYQTDNQNASIELSNSTITESVHTSKEWTLYWLIPLILVIIIPILFLLCLALHHFLKRKHRVKLPLSSTHPVDVMEPAVSSWAKYSNSYNTGIPMGQNGYYHKKRNTLYEPPNESPNKTNLKMMPDSQHKSLSKYAKLKLFHTKKIKSPSPSRKLINWQESGTLQFAIPPSPKSASSTIQMHKKKPPPPSPSNFSLIQESNFTKQLYNSVNSLSQIPSGDATISLRCPEEMRSISQCSVLFPQACNNRQETFSPYPHCIQHDYNNTTTFSRYDQQSPQPKLFTDTDDNVDDHRIYYYNDHEVSNEEDTCDQVSSITMQPTVIVQQPNVNLFPNQSFDAFIDYESQQQQQHQPQPNMEQFNVYNTQYNDWTLDKTTMSRIPRI